MTQQRRVLLSKASDARVNAVHGGASIVFGLPFLAAGGAIVGVAKGWISVDPSSIHAPLYVLSACGWAFALAGLLVMGAGCAGLRRNLAARRLRQEYPDQPWWADHPWAAEGEWCSDGWRVMSAIKGCLFLALFLIPFWWVATTQGGALVWGFLGVFGLIVLYAVGYTLYVAARWLKFGTSHLLFTRFPFHPGESLDVVFSPSRDVVLEGPLVATLRFVEEVVEKRRSGNKTTTYVARYGLHEDEQTVALSQGVVRAGEEIPLSFPLPADPELTDSLGSYPPRYWELSIHAATPGVDYKSGYLVPVYLRPGTEVPAAAEREPALTA